MPSILIYIKYSSKSVDYIKTLLQVCDGMCLDKLVKQLRTIIIRCYYTLDLQMISIKYSITNISIVLAK